MASVIKARVNPQFNRAANLKGVADFRKQTKFYPFNVGVKVQPYQPSVLIGYPTQMLVYIRFV